MVRAITCPGCSQNFGAPADLTETWLECPHYLKRVVNLTALESTESVWRTAAGVILAVLALLGGGLWLMATVMSVEEVLHRPILVGAGRVLIRVSIIACMAIPCALLFYAARLLMRAGARPADRGPRTAMALSLATLSFLLGAALVTLLNIFRSPHEGT